MDKILKRVALLFSSYEPIELYLGFAAVVIISAFIVLLSSFTLISRKERHGFTLLSIPSFCAIAPAIFSVFTLISGRVNAFTCVLAVLAGLLLNHYFIRESCADSQTYLCFGGNDEKNIDTARFILYGGLFLISVIYLFSIDHNWVGPQYDVTSYQFIGDLLFRKKVYPVIPFAGDNTIAIITPPGYFIYDFVSRLLWNSPRAGLLLSVFFFIASSIAFVRLGSLVFKNRKVELFVLLALLTRGLFWSFWEFNLPRAVSLISSIMFLCALIGFYRAPDIRRSVSHILFAQIFFSSAILTQPQHCAYMVGGAFVIAAILFLARIFKNRGIERKKGLIFFISLLLPVFLFCLWYFPVVARHSPAAYLLSRGQSPIPKITGLLFHFNGVVPILLTLAAAAGVLLRGKKQRNWAAAAAFLFIFALALSYFQGFMAKILPKSFELVDFGVVDDFTSARYFVKTPLINPTSIISKMISFWWFTIIAMGWVFFWFWGRLKRRIQRIGFIIIAIVILSGDVLFMYYNKPIIKKDEYLFLKNLEKYLPEEAVIIAPPGYQFSAWTGPVLHRDSISNRASTVHSVNSISKDINQQIAQAYEKLNFSALLKKLPSGNTFVLFNRPYGKEAKQFLKDNNWQLVFDENDNYCFKYKSR